MEAEVLVNTRTGLTLRRGVSRGQALQTLARRREDVALALGALRAAPRQAMLRRVEERDLTYLVAAIQRCASFGDSAGLLRRAAEDPRAFAQIRSQCIPFDSRGPLPLFALAPKMKVGLNLRSRLLTWRDLAAVGLEHCDRSLGAQERWVEKHVRAAPAAPVPPPGGAAAAPAPGSPDGAAPGPSPTNACRDEDLPESWEDLMAPGAV